MPTVYLHPKTVGGRTYLAPLLPPSASDPAPTGTILPTPPPDPSGQEKRFILTTTDTVSGAYTLIGQNGAANIGPTAFAIANNAADFTVQGIAAATYLPRFTLTGQSGQMTNIDGALFTIVGVSGGGGVGTQQPSVSGGGGGPVREIRAYAAQFDRVERTPKPKPKAKPPEPPKKKRWQDYLPQ